MFFSVVFAADVVVDVDGCMRGVWIVRSISTAWLVLGRGAVRCGVMLMMMYVVLVWGCPSVRDHEPRMCSVHGCCLGVGCVSTSYTHASSPWL